MTLRHLRDMLASSTRQLLTLASCCSPRIHPPLASVLRSEADSTAAERRRVVAALKRFDQLEAMSSRGDPEGCSCALEELRRLREDGTAFALGPNAHNRAMRVCASSPGTVETLFAEAAAAGVQDDASLQVLATCRLEAEDFAGAAAALSELLGPLLVQPARGVARRRVPARTAKVALSVLGACRDASVCGDECRGAGRVQPRPNRRDPTAETAPRRHAWRGCFTGFPCAWQERRGSGRPSLRRASGRLLLRLPRPSGPSPSSSRTASRVGRRVRWRL